MIARELKEKLRRRETQVGTFVKLADPTAMEVLGLAGMDFAIVDTEHAPCDQMLLLDLLRAADSVGLPTIVRVPEGTEPYILKTLDLGASGVQIPGLSTVEEIDRAISFTKYAPRGVRGLSFAQRSAGYGTKEKFRYMQDSNEGLINVVHIENKDAAAHTEELCRRAAIAIAFALPAKAQVTPFTYFNVDWQFNAPISNNFANKASGWGMNFEGGYYILPDLSIGAFINYHTNNEYISRQTLPISNSAALTTDQQHSVFQLPFGFATHYRFSDGACQPYIGLKLGANYTKMSSDFYIYEVKDNTWGFYVSPEVGVNIYPWTNSIGFHLAAFYSYSTNKGTVFNYDMDKLNNFGFRLGVAF